MQRGVFHTRLIERFVQNVFLGIAFVEELDERISLPIKNLVLFAADLFFVVSIHPILPF